MPGGRPDQDGDRQLGQLEEAWATVRQHWHDDMVREFDAGCWAPLQHESRSYTEALRKLMEVLDAAERATQE
jgi:hypothetical protein